MDGSYYCGHTDDLVVRMRQHEEGDIGYTRDRKPLQLLWQGEFETRQGALAFELQVKGWSRAKKEALIRGDWEGIQRLARSKSSSFQSVTHSPFSVRPEPPNSVRPEPVEGAGGDASPRLRQAQPERGWMSPDHLELILPTALSLSNGGQAHCQRNVVHLEVRSFGRTSHRQTDARCIQRVTRHLRHAADRPASGDRRLDGL